VPPEELASERTEKAALIFMNVFDVHVNRMP